MNETETLSTAVAVDQSNAIDLGQHENDDLTRYVVVEINKNMYGISTDSTVELMDSSTTQITRVSHAPPYVQGVINHRGSIIPAIDVRSLLGFTSHQDGVRELEEMLAEREKDHLQWLIELKECVSTGAPFTKATDPTKCAFGKWYDKLRSNEALFDTLTKKSTKARAIVDQFDAPHRRIHSIAGRVLKMVEDDQHAQAQKIIKEAWDNDLGHMRRLFKTLIDTVRPIHTSMTIITEQGNQRIALIVDQVHSVFDCDPAAIEPLPDSTASREFLQGLVHQEDGSYILIADIEYIYSKTSTQ